MDPSNFQVPAAHLLPGESGADPLVPVERRADEGRRGEDRVPAPVRALSVRDGVRPGGPAHPMYSNDCRAVLAVFALRGKQSTS